MTDTSPAAAGPAANPNRRLFGLLAVAAGLILVVLVLPRLLFGGGDDGGDEALPTPPSPPLTTTTLPPSESPPETFEFFSTKNPFAPLVDTGAGGGAAGGTTTGGTTGGGTGAGTGSTGGTGTGTGSAGGTSGGSTGGTTGSTGGTSGGGAAGTDTEPRSMQRVALLEVFNDTDGTVVANVRVNDTVYEVAEGEQFATHYRVLSLSLDGGCAELLFGDDRFRICEGEELLK